jgi:hypothetical protein
MTHTSFEEWIQDMNRIIKKQNPKILLLVDNVICHSVTKVMSNTTVNFLPPNLASGAQPLD